MSTYISLEPESCIKNLQYKYHSPVLINYGTSWGARSSTNSALKDTRTESHNSRCIVYSDYNFRSRTLYVHVSHRFRHHLDRQSYHHLDCHSYHHLDHHSYHHLDRSANLLFEGKNISFVRLLS